MSIVRPYPLRFRPIPSGRRAQPLTSARGSGSTTMAGHRLHLTFWYNLAAVALLLALLHGPLAEAQPLPWQLCNATAGNYTEGSAYQANVRALASALPANASSSRALFAEGAAGTAPDKVYAIALCRGDTNASSCAACLAAAFDTAQQLCAFNRRATLFNDPCILRYSDQDILANVTDNRGMFVAWNYNNVSTGRMAVFDATSGQLVNTSGDYASAVYDAFSGMLVNATADYAAKDSVRRFGTGEMGFNVFDSPYHNIFSLAQCTPDMSEADCRSCLGDIIRRMMPKYFVGKPGGRVFGVRCNFRFEAYEFFSGRPLLQLSGLPPSPPPPGLSAPSGLPPSPPGGGDTGPGTQILVIILPLVAISSVAAISICMWNIRKKRRWRRAENLSAPDTAEDFESIKSTLLSLSSLQVATDNFDENKKLGEGGFGAVYKGLLSGQEVAVKRLAKGSSQGLEELKNELVLVAKLHHRNLVRLVGFCLEEGERMLVYEYMPNKSLDFFLFDPEKRRGLDWVTRFKIIEGVARGLQYLHQDSRKKIVHRDMKASNILLDTDMNPKIGDFGLARLFGQDQTRDVTNRIVGTFGYMSPEYVMRGQYSTKSDVFSFGVLIIEIVTGQRNNRPYLFEQNEDIISTVWRRWSDGTVAKMIDHSLGKNYPEAEVLKCINIGLLCLQENPVNRPTMADIMVLLNSNASSSIPAPAARPTFSFDGSSRYSQTITQLSAR
ncbi:cysteine-rich receptor-like protein kinase 10 isoform X2 [Oryza sativa Japonica Group]|uniref:cysteine-rich receptor-like protein kinase 10 isoform X2 n=1 Tax=Oryza sativa subsp. japonica TaxID=39947 RepID=UPI00339BB5C8